MKTLFIKRSFLLAAAVIACAGVALGLFAGAAANQAGKTDPKTPTVVVDAGHGGIDNGVQGVISHTDESDVNLAIAKYLKGDFLNAGFNCVMTRSTEAGLYGTTEKGFKARDMSRRREIIEECDPDMVISIHQNFCPLPSRRGGTVFFDESSETGARLAAAIQEELNALPECPKPNQALRGDYYMLKCTQNPSVIVECGFLSNAEDDRLLNDDNFRKAVAYAVFKGAVRYLANRG